MRRAVVGFLVLIALVLAGFGLTAPDAAESLERQAFHIASGLRCPSCDGVSVADSPSPIARAIYGRITSELRHGRDAEQIKAGLVASYGDWILIVPPRRGLNLLPWLAPAAVAAAAAVWLWLATRRRRAGATR